MSEPRSTPAPIRVDVLRELRVGKGWTVEELAAKSGVPKRTVERLCAHGRGNPRTIADVAQALGVDPTVLVARHSEATLPAPRPALLRRDEPHILVGLVWRTSDGSGVYILAAVRDSKYTAFIEAIRQKALDLNAFDQYGCLIPKRAMHYVNPWTVIDAAEPIQGESTTETQFEVVPLPFSTLLPSHRDRPTVPPEQMMSMYRKILRMATYKLDPDLAIPLLPPGARVETGIQWQRQDGVLMSVNVAMTENEFWEFVDLVKTQVIDLEYLWDRGRVRGSTHGPEDGLRHIVDLEWPPSRGEYQGVHQIRIIRPRQAPPSSSS